jgi:hypothetical protein
MTWGFVDGTYLQPFHWNDGWNAGTGFFSETRRDLGGTLER